MSLPLLWRQQGRKPLPIQWLEAIEVTTSFDAICHCCLIHGSCHWTRISSGYNNGVAHVKKDGWSAFICPCHLHMTCSMCWTILSSACFI